MTSTVPSVLDALAHPDATAAGLAGCTPQAVLVEALTELTPSMLSVEGRIDAVVAVQRHIGMLQARSVELLAAIEAADETEDGFVREAVAAALRVPPGSMRSRMDLARSLAERLPAAMALLAAGLVSQRHAFDLAEATASLSPGAAAAVEARVLPRAAEQTAAQFRAAIRRAVLRVSDPVEQQAAHRDALAQRRVIVTPVQDGMAELWALLPADGAATVSAALDALAHNSLHRRGGTDRTADQRRADGLVDLASTALIHRALGRGQRQRPAVQITVAASTLMGLDDQPGDLDGYGPVTAAMARRIAADETATWRRLVTDDHGHVTSMSRKAYRPTAAMVDLVLARDRHCVFPGCRRAAKYSDLDHVQPYRRGDETTTANLTVLCRRHHRLKHTSWWHLTRDDDTGVTTWRDRRGRSYQSRPPDRPTTVDIAETGQPVSPSCRRASRLLRLPTMNPDPDPPF